MEENLEEISEGGKSIVFDVSCPECRIVSSEGDLMTGASLITECKLQPFRYGDLVHAGEFECADYGICNNENYRKCPIYHENHQIEFLD